MVTIKEKDLLDIGGWIKVGCHMNNSPIGIHSCNSYKLACDIIKQKKYKSYTIRRRTYNHYSLKAYSIYENGFTPPTYDQNYFDAIEILNSNDDY